MRTTAATPSPPDVTDLLIEKVSDHVQHAVTAFLYPLSMQRQSFRWTALPADTSPFYVRQDGIEYMLTVAVVLYVCRNSTNDNEKSPAGIAAGLEISIYIVYNKYTLHL